jgi:hypothetical protein
MVSMVSITSETTLVPAVDKKTTGATFLKYEAGQGDN